MRGLSQRIMSMGPDDRQRAIEGAGGALAEGGAVVLPTDTLYGVFVRAAPGPAELLDRVTGNPPADEQPRFTLHLSDPESLIENLRLETPVARRLVERLLPGAARLVIHQPEDALVGVRAALGIEPGLGDNGRMIAVRVPDHPIARAVIRASGAPTLARALGASKWTRGDDAGTDLEHFGGLEGPDGPGAVIDDGPTLHRHGSTTIVMHRSGRFDVEPGGPVSEEEVMGHLNTRILFVCTGNTCRSPMAAALAEHLVRELEPRGISISVESAGVEGGEGQAATPEAVEALKERGIDLGAHRSRTLDAEMIERADLVLTMTPSHAQAVMQMAPGSVHKIFPIDPARPVGDPIGGPIEVYQEVADRLAELIRAKLAEMQS